MDGVTGTNLSGKKSWFFLGDKIVAMGSGISGTSDSGIETIVDNRKIDDKGDNTLVVNGAMQSVEAGWHATLANVSWAHVQGNRSGSEIGYVFPQRTVLYALREHRSGNWKTNDQGHSDDFAGNNFLSLAIEHGQHANNREYAYVLLPGRSAASTRAFAAQPTVEILENSAEASAVADRSLDVVGANIWKDGGKTIQKDGLPYLNCDSEAAVVVEERDGRLAVAVADPTQHHHGDITIELYRKAHAPLQVPTGVTILQLNPSIRFKVKIDGLEGATLTTAFATISN